MNQAEIFGRASVSTAVYNRIKQFAADVYETNKDKYAARNQHDKEAIINQHAAGKLGEWLVYDALHPYFPDMSEPDMEIYESNQKSWAPDLSAAGLDFIVKSQDKKSRQSYPESWTFQVSDKSGRGGRDKEVFDNPQPTSLCVFVSVDFRFAAGAIRGIIPVPILHKHELFRPPEKENLEGIKQTVHFFDLKQKNFSQRIPQAVLKKALTPDSADLEV